MTQLYPFMINLEHQGNSHLVNEFICRTELRINPFAFVFSVCRLILEFIVGFGTCALIIRDLNLFMLYE